MLTPDTTSNMPMQCIQSILTAPKYCGKKTDSMMDVMSTSGVTAFVIAMGREGFGAVASAWKIKRLEIVPNVIPIKSRINRSVVCGINSCGVSNLV